MLMNGSGSLRPSFSLSAFCRISSLAFVAGASAAALSAQAVPAPAMSAQPASQLVAALSPDHLNLTTVPGLTYSSSSSSVDMPADAENADHLDLTAEGLQPPPRRRYGRPRYNDSSHNPDGSNKYTFVLGAGFTAPIGNTYHYLNTNYAFQVGGGRNFNKHFGVLAQFDYDRFGFNGRTIANQAALYNYFCTSTLQLEGYCTPLTSLDGNTHDWSFTLDPIYNVFAGDTWGGYVVGGVGFFHKVANFTTPEVGVGYSPYYGYYQYQANVNIDHYTSNAPGFDGGVGITYKISKFAGERLFAEARYVITLNSQRTGLTAQNVNSTFGLNYAGYNDYPENSNRTTYLVYKAGIRF